MYGLTEKNIHAIRSVLSRFSSIEQAILYGSRAKGDYRKGSDIDLSLIGDKLDLSILIQIENELDDLLLPYKFDLSIFHKIESSELVDHIKRVGTVFYIKESQ